MESSTTLSTLLSLLPIAGPLVVAATWLRLRTRADAQRPLLAVWVVALVAQALAGGLVPVLDGGDADPGLSLLFSSSLWLLGPGLLALGTAAPRLLPGLAVVLLTPPLGAVLGLFVAFATGTISPCG